jgi:hypothetical protein
LVSKVILNSPVGVLPIFAGLDEAVAEAAESGFVNIDVACDEHAFSRSQGYGVVVGQRAYW